MLIIPAAVDAQIPTSSLYTSCMAIQACVHIDAVKEIKQPQQRVCEECVKIGAQWVHLRTCQQCGTTRCCDSSPNRHATKHFTHTTHPVMASFEPGERWAWCYVDKMDLDVPPRIARSLR